MWAGITWSALSRVQALAKLSAVDDLKVHLILSSQVLEGP